MSEIVVEHVRKTYGKKNALEDIHFHITNPGVYLLAGPNGSGKTTLIEILAGLRQATSGNIKLNGFHPGSVEAKQHVGFLCQQNNLRKNCTVREELVFIKQLFDKQEVDDIAYLKQFDLEDYYEYKTKKLSGGLQRRLLIAMTFMANQDIIILDEPVSGLDTNNRDEIWNAIKEYSKDKIVVVSDHYLNQAAVYSDYIFMMDRGNMIIGDYKEKILDRIDYQKVVRVKKKGFDEIQKAVEQHCSQFTIKNSGSVYHIFIKDYTSDLEMFLQDKRVDIRNLDLEDIYFYYTGSQLHERNEYHENL